MGWRRGASKGQKEQPEWFHPLRSLVQAGIPMVSHPFQCIACWYILKGSQQPKHGIYGANSTHT